MRKCVRHSPTAIGKQLRIRAHLLAVVCATMAIVALSACSDSSAPATPMSGESAISQMRLASINGVESGREWLAARGDSIEATGVLSSGSSVVRVKGADPDLLQLTLYVTEATPDARLRHALPLIVPDEAVLTLDGRSIPVSEVLESLMTGSPEFYGTASATFQVRGAFLFVTRMEVDSSTELSEADMNLDNAELPVGLLKGRAASVDGDSRVWLSITEGESVDIEGYPGSVLSGSGIVSQGFLVPDLLGTALIFHDLPLSFQTASKPYDLLDSGKQGDQVKLKVQLNGGSFVVQ